MSYPEQDKELKDTQSKRGKEHIFCLKVWLYQTAKTDEFCKLQYIKINIKKKKLHFSIPVMNLQEKKSRKEFHIAKRKIQKTKQQKLLSGAEECSSEVRVLPSMHKAPVYPKIKDQTDKTKQKLLS